MAYEIVNQFPDGTYHLRDNATGEELPADEGTMQGLAQAGQLSMGGPPKPAPAVPPPQLAPMGPPAPPPQDKGNPFLPSLGQVGGALKGAARAFGAPPSAAPAAPPTAAPAQQPAQRIGVRAAPQGPAQRDPNAGLVVQRTGGSPAAWVPTGRSSQGIGEGTEDALQEQARGLHESRLETARVQEETRRTQLMADKKAAEDDYLMKTIRADAKQAAINEKETFRQTTRDALDERRAKVRNMQVDPDLVWKQKGVGAQILAAIAVGMGQFGAGMTGQENMAAKMISNMVDRSIDAQKVNINKETADYAEDNDEYHRSIVGGADADRLEQKQLRLDAAEAYTRGILADKDLAYLHPAAMQTADDLAAQALDVQTKLEQLTVQRADERYQPAMAASTRITVNPLLEAQVKAKKLQDELTGGGAKDGYAPVLYNGQVVTQLPREEAKLANAELLRLDNAIDTQNQIVKKVSQGGWTSNLNDEAVGELTSLRSAQVGNLKSPGENSDADAERIVERMGAEYQFRGKAEAAARATLRQLEAERNRLTKQLGVPNIESQQQLDTTE